MKTEKEYKTNSISGLSAQEAARRLALLGNNEIPQQKRKSWGWIFMQQFKNPLIYFLLIAAILIFFVGKAKIDAFVISGILFFNALIGTIQEGRTSGILESLQQFFKTTCVVIRDGQKQLVNDTQLVPGDLIVLQEGQRVPADAKLISCNGLQVDESALTGESQAIRKSIQELPENTPLADRTHMIYKGTYILSGSAHAIVVATGLQTEIGKIQKSVQLMQTDIPLRKDLDRLSYSILIFILILCSMLFIVGLLMGKPFDTLLTMLTALFICVVPEGLPVVLTLVLVSGVYRMAQKRVLVKNLQAVETLGRTDVIVIDKTGTLTRNEMMVSSVYCAGEAWTVTGQGYYAQGELYKDGVLVAGRDDQQHIRALGVAASLLNSAEVIPVDHNRFDIKGDPTEAALYILSLKLGLNRDELMQQYVRIYEIPFDPKLRYHAGFYRIDEAVVIFITGSPELLMQWCQPAIRDGEHEHLASMLDQGLRVVALAQKVITQKDWSLKNPQSVEEYAQQVVGVGGFDFLGLCGIQDSIRVEVAPMIAQTRAAGIRIVMATGDHQKTALYVAKSVGLFQAGDRAITGQEMDQMSDEQLRALLSIITVYSRVSPLHKMRIIDLFHQEHMIVAMTGDGINDAPSLVAADLGIAMGVIGTQVAKEASDIILLDDSFATIIAAVAQGRHIFYTLRRVVLYFFSTNMGEILMVLFALFTWLPLPISATQILWLNLVTDGFFDMAIAMESQEQELLEPGWLARKPSLIDDGLLIKMMVAAVPMGITSLVIFWWYYAVAGTGIIHARTMVLVTMSLFQWFNAWNCRSERKSIMQVGFFTNKWLLVATGLVFVLQWFILHVPILQMIFNTMPLSAADWAVATVASFPIIIIEETRKWFVRRFF